MQTYFILASELSHRIIFAFFLLSTKINEVGAANNLLRTKKDEVGNAKTAFWEVAKSVLRAKINVVSGENRSTQSEKKSTQSQKK